MNLAVVGENIISYEYDHFGIRTAKNVNGCRTELVNDGDSVIAELCQGEVTNYYRGLSLIGYEDSNNLYYYRLNAHGDTIGIVDGFGNQVKTYSYDAFGSQGSIDTLDTNPFRYCGEYFDSETELIYLRARYYDPSIQRFVSEDPICDSVNWYAYCDNNPVCRIDRNGQWWETAFDVVSLTFSIGDVISDPTNGWAWLGLAGDVVDLIPVVGGVGEAVRAARIADNASDIVSDTAKGLNAIDNVTDATKVGVEVWGKAASSKVLRENMIVAGKVVPDYKNAAHHIVAGTSKKANEARDILKKFDIDINHSANGVFLPTQKGVSSAAYHPSLHTDEYYTAINEMLKGADNREDAISILNDIGKQLQEGTLKY